MDDNLLIISCSKRKRRVNHGLKVPAGELYDGPVYRVIRNLKRKQPYVNLNILIVSAKYGLVQWDEPIELYDLRMSSSIAEQLKPQILNKLQLMPLTGKMNVYIEVGKDYRAALPDLSCLWPQAHITYGQGKIGYRLHDLLSWLEKAGNEKRG
jgi:hypothetical protein